MKIRACSTFCSGSDRNIHPPFKEEQLRDIEHNLSMALDTKKSIFGWLSLLILFIMTLYNRMRQAFLQKVTAIFLQNATKVYYKMCQVFYSKISYFYYKMQQLLQNEMFINI